MALETLKGVEKIGGFAVVVMDELREKYPHKFNESGAMDWQWFEAEIRPHAFICQVGTMIAAAKLMIERLNLKYPCRENSMTITKLDEALMWLEKRTKDREARGVEGHDKP